MVLLSDADGDILLLPVGVRHVKNTRTWLPTLLYTLLQRQCNQKQLSHSAEN